MNEQTVTEPEMEINTCDRAWQRRLENDGAKPESIQVYDGAVAEFRWYVVPRHGLSFQRGLDGVRWLHGDGHGYRAIADAMLVIGVTTKITTALGETGGTTGYAVGTAADPNRWGDVSGVATTVSSDNTDHTSTTIQLFTAANNVVLTAAGGNFDGTGVIHVSIQYLIGQAD